VFSLGTNVRSDKLDKNVQKALLEAFSKISETVIWKFESELENSPKNVIVRKWLPQNDVLGLLNLLSNVSLTKK
jgi:glucuronosyltransferase